MTGSFRDVRFNRGAMLVAAIALVLILGSVAQIVYRYTLPTDGWAVLTEDVSDTNWLYYQNLVGATSDLQTDDAVLEVDGVPVHGTASESYVPAPPGWQKGQTVTILVRRGEASVEVAVPVVGWTGKALLQYNVLFLVQFTSVSGALLLLAVGWFTLLRRPEVPSARALLVLSTAVGATFISGILPDGLSVQFDRTAYWLTSFYSYMIFGILLAPSVLTFTLLFPEPKRAIQKNPWLAYLPYAFGSLLLLFLIFDGPAESGWFSTLAMFVLSIISFIHSWITQRDPVSRAQLRWAVSGFVLGLGLFMLNFPLAFNLVSNPVLIYLMLGAQSLGFLVIGLGLAIAVLRYHLFDIDVIIRKTLIYVGLTVTLALAYFGGVVLLQSLFETISGQQSPIAIVISTLLIAALFNPLHKRIQNAIDRRFYRRKYNAEQALAEFAATARSETDLKALIAQVEGIVKKTMQPEQVSLWLKPDAIRWAKPPSQEIG